MLYEVITVLDPQKAIIISLVNECDTALPFSVASFAPSLAEQQDNGASTLAPVRRGGYHGRRASIGDE